MKIWFDTEFMEDGRTIDLLSIGMVREDGAELYLEAGWADLSKANDWVQANVLPHMMGPTATTVEHMREAVLSFCGAKPEFWGYYCDYDWVALCQLFGRMVDLPKGWPMYCRDLKQLADSMGNPRLPEMPGKTDHHALSDAEEIRYRWIWLFSRGILEEGYVK